MCNHFSNPLTPDPEDKESPDDTLPHYPLLLALATKFGMAEHVGDIVAAQWLDRIQDDVIDRVIAALPQGCGIDKKWTGEFAADQSHDTAVLQLRNGYHGMDEFGGYDGWVDFVLEVFLDASKESGLDFTLEYSPSLDSKELSEKDWACGLNEMLEGTIHDALKEAKIID